MADLDYSDPCAVLAALKKQRVDVLLGKQVKKVRYRSDTAAEQEVENQRVDLAALDREIARYEVLCAQSQGLNGQRCILAG